MVSVRTLALQGEIDIARQHSIEQELSKIESFGSNSVAILDLSDVQYADTTLLNALVNIKKRAPGGLKGGRVFIVAPRHIAKLFQITELDRLFPTFGDMTAAHLYASSL